MPRALSLPRVPGMVGRSPRVRSLPRVPGPVLRSPSCPYWVMSDMACEVGL